MKDKLLKITHSPIRGLLPHEWAVIFYVIMTLSMVVFCSTSYADPSALVWTRVKLVAAMLAFWGLYRLLPCPLMMLVRVLSQILLLGEWYPDTYTLNSILTNLDPVVATWEQEIFHCQPSLLFSEQMPWWWFSELMHFGYGSYYFLLLIVPLMYFARYRADFLRASFILITSFFLFYIIFDFLPVAGPQYYFHAIGTDSAMKGVFPDVGTYFATHRECLPMPGSDGPCHIFVQTMHDAGERPTAAFPSSHVGIATVLLLLLGRYCKKLKTLEPLVYYIPIYILLSLSTVYIKAHYAIDAIAGLVFGVIFYFALNTIFNAGSYRGIKVE